MKEHTYNTYIVNSNLGSKRELSHTIKSRCACVWMYMVANLILLCSLKTYLSFKTWEQLCKKTWAVLFISSFLGGHRSTHCFQYLGHLSIFFNFFSFFLFFMNNFCIAPCLFSATKLLRDSNKNLEHLFSGYPIGYIFGVHSQCRSKTFLSGSKWNGIFLRLPSV